MAARGTSTVMTRELAAAVPQRRNFKIDAATVTEIRERYARGDVSGADLAKYYGICRENVLHIVRRSTWRDIP